MHLEIEAVLPFYRTVQPAIDQQIKRSTPLSSRASEGESHYFAVLGKYYMPCCGRE